MRIPKTDDRLDQSNENVQTKANLGRLRYCMKLSSIRLGGFLKGISPRFESQVGASVILKGVAVIAFLLCGSAFSQQTPTGFYYPLGKKPVSLDITAGFLAGSPTCDSSSGPCLYVPGKYHLGIDMWDSGLGNQLLMEGKPVYAIADGEVADRSDGDDSWGPGNCALLIRHTTNDGVSFLAVYGHVRSELTRGSPVYKGSPVGNVGPYPESKPHLHFGINTNLQHRFPLGRWDLSDQNLPTFNFQSPIKWIETRTPEGTVSVRAVASATGTPISFANVNLGGFATTTDENGLFYLPGSLCSAPLFLSVSKGFLSFWELFPPSWLCNLQKSTFTTRAGDTADYEVELLSKQSCNSLGPTNRFSIGDRVQVLGTGVGLRARYPNPCTSAWMVMHDGALGTIVGGPECCDGYHRWKIRYDQLPGLEAWSAEGEPETGEYFLYKVGSATIAISGTVTRNGTGLSGVTMLGLPGNPATAANGTYGVFVPSGWTGKVTPSKPGYAFSPPSISYSNLTTNKYGQDYTATAVPTGNVNISGYITLDNQPMPHNVTLQVTPSVSGSPFTVRDSFSITVPAGWSGSIRPSASGYTFQPPDHEFTSITKNQTYQDFRAIVVKPRTQLTVNITPAEAVADGAAWRISGPKVYEFSYHAPGTTRDVTNYRGTDNSIRIEFKYLTDQGWNTPEKVTLQIPEGESRELSRAYTPIAGGVSVTIEPQAARDAGAQWRVDGGEWRTSGFSEQGLEIGFHTVEFQAVPGWITPGNRSISVANLETTSFTETYINQGTGPKILEVSPNSGPLEGGTEVTIQGANLASGAEVFFGGTPATNVTVVNPMTISAVVPPRPVIGSVDVVINQGSESTTITNGFTYLFGVGQNLTLVGQLGGQAGAIDVQGNYAYLGEGPNVVVLDISSTNPVRVGKILLEDEVRGIHVSGTRAYVAGNSKGLYIIDVSNPQAPGLLGIYDTPGTALYVKELGGRAYVADRTEGLRIIDVANPALPVELGSLPIAGEAQGLALRVAPDGVFAYVACGESGLTIVDVSSPSTPIVRAVYDTPAEAKKVEISGNLAYVADSFNYQVNSGLRIIDVSNPDAPIEIGHYESWAEDVEVIENTAYLIKPAFTILNVSDPSHPVKIGINLDLAASVTGIAVTGGRAFVACNDKGIEIYNVANPASPFLESTYPASVGNSLSIAAFGDYAYLGLQNDGLRVVNAQNPADPSALGSFNEGDARDISVNGSLLYLGHSRKGMPILDVSNPLSPIRRGQLDSVYSLSTAYANGKVYLGGSDFPNYHIIFQIVNVSNPDFPAALGTLDFGPDLTSPIEDVTVSGNYAYLAHGDYGLRIVDISNSGSPSQVGQLDTPVYAKAVYLDGNRAYVAGDIGSTSGSLQTVNVLNPAAPFLEDEVAVPTRANDVIVDDGLAYVACSTAGLEVLDVSGPTIDPVPVAWYDTSGSARDIWLINGLIYVADGSGGFVILRLRDFEYPSVTITNPVFDATYATNSPSVGLGGSANDNRGITRVEWSNHRGGSGIASGAGSWSVASIPLQPAENVITVLAYDEAGNAGSDSITVTYNLIPDTTPPNITIESPVAKSYVSTTPTVAISGTANDDRGLSQVTWSSNRGEQGNAAGMEQWSIPAVTLHDGTNTITVTAFDTSGNSSDAILDVEYDAPDTTLPTVQSVTRLDPSPTNAETVRYQVTFSEDVENVTSAAFALEADLGILLPSVVDIAGTGKSRELTLNTGVGDGSLRLDVRLEDFGIVDLAGNPLAGGYTSAESYLIDKSEPVLILGSPSSTLTKSGPVAIPYQFVGAESIAFDATAIALMRSGSANGTLSLDQSRKSTGTITLSNLVGNGSLQILVAAGTASDSAGNIATSAGPTALIEVDNTPPLVSISSPSVTSTSTGPVTYTVSYDGASSISLSSASVALIQTGDAEGSISVTGTGLTERRVIVSGISGTGTLGIAIGSGTAVDGVGNVATGVVFSQTFQVDDIQTGSLMCRILPGQARKAGARWRVETDPGVWSDWMNHKDVVSDLTLGPHTVEFTALSGWDCPSYKTVNIVENATEKKTGIYVQNGSLLVTLKPAGARQSGATWRVEKSPGKWSISKKSNTMVTGLSPGTHFVECSVIGGWATPKSRTVEIVPTAGTKITRNYQPLKSLATGDEDTRDQERAEAATLYMDNPIREEVLPLSAEVSTDGTVPQEAILGLRFSAEVQIDPASAWANLEIEGEDLEGGFWRSSVTGDDLDGWVLVALPPDLADGVTVTMVAGASTIDGIPLGPVSAEFRVMGQPGDEFTVTGRPFLVEESDVPPLPETEVTPASSVYRIRPVEVFDEPVTVRVPVAEGVDPAEVEVFYFSESEAHPGWYHADDMLGWLMPGSVRIIDENGKTFVEFEVNHSGVVQLAVRRGEVESAGIGLCMGALLVIAVCCGRSMRRTHGDRG